MAAITVSEIKPAEDGTAIITLTFTDEDGTTVIPTELKWQLMETDGTIINNRTFALGSFTGTTIVLFGDDLAIEDGESLCRILSVQGIYDSTAGNNLPIKGELMFWIDAFIENTNINTKE
jgi:hypothetical protein